MQKHVFTEAERYAVWLHHGKRCWLCLEPLDLVAATVDHVVPEILTDDPIAMQEMIDLFALPATFNINSFENWLPAHHHCNQSKSRRRLEYVPKQKFIFEELIKKAETVRKTAEKLGQRGKKGRVLATVLMALETGILNIDDLDVALDGNLLRPTPSEELSLQNFIQLDTGYWIRRDEIAYEGPCECDRTSCVDSNGKVDCLFSRHLSNWVINSRLYWKCYDEQIVCNRCGNTHKRGHVGRLGFCGYPFANQENGKD